MRRTSAQLKILSVCAALSLFLWSSPTFPGLTTGNERKCLSCYHQKVFPFCSLRRSANGCTWFSFQLWKPGECEGCPGVQAPGSPPAEPPPFSEGLLRPSQRLGGRGSKSVFPGDILIFSIKNRLLLNQPWPIQVPCVTSYMTKESHSLFAPIPTPNQTVLRSLKSRFIVPKLFWGLIALGIQLMLHKYNLHMSN